MSFFATEEVDQHPLWAELEAVSEWLTSHSGKFHPDYEGDAVFANSVMRRVEMITSLARLHLSLVPREVVSTQVLNSLKEPLVSIYTKLQPIDWKDGGDFDEDLETINQHAESLLQSLYDLGVDPSNGIDLSRAADGTERERVSQFLTQSERVVSTLRAKQKDLDESIRSNKLAGEESLNELREEIVRVAGAFEDEIEEGVEVGRQRIDDQISNLQTQYTTEIEKQRQRAEEDLAKMLLVIREQKKELDELVDKTKKVSGYVAEDAMSRMFKKQAEESKNLWITFTIAASCVALVSACVLYFAGYSALEEQASSVDIARGVVRAFVGLGAGTVAFYLFRQASLQQRSYQDSRSAAVRLGSLDAFLAPFDDEDAQEVRRGVGQRVYIDGQLGEIARGGEMGKDNQLKTPREQIDAIRPDSGVLEE